MRGGGGVGIVVLTFAPRRNVLFAFKRAPRFLHVIPSPPAADRQTTRRPGKSSSRVPPFDHPPPAVSDFMILSRRQSFQPPLSAARGGGEMAFLFGRSNPKGDIFLLTNFPTRRFQLSPSTEVRTSARVRCSCCCCCCGCGLFPRTNLVWPHLVSSSRITMMISTTIL